MREIELLKIIGIEGENSASASVIKEYEINISRPESGGFTVSLPENEAPIYYTCGDICWSGFTEGQKIT